MRWSRYEASWSGWPICAVSKVWTRASQPARQALRGTMHAARGPSRVEQPMRPKMHVLCGALVMKALLMLNNCSVVSHEVGGHRTAP